MTIGDNVYIDKDCIICALKIGNNVQIGKNCVIGHKVQIHDNCKILDNSILPPDTIVPPFTVYGGRPAQFIAELPETIGIVHKEFTTNYYNMFQEYKGPAGVEANANVSSRQSTASKASVKVPG